MISVIKALMTGDQEIVRRFVKAEEFWHSFFEASRNLNEAELAARLDRAQIDFEWLLGMDRGFAKEIMPYTALASLYDEQSGFDNENYARMVASGEAGRCPARA